MPLFDARETGRHIVIWHRQFPNVCRRQLWLAFINPDNSYWSNLTAADD
ncbi:MAG: hypothetical protein WB608_09965 [Terracidiphilus sp.]